MVVTLRKRKRKFQRMQVPKVLKLRVHAICPSSFPHIRFYKFFAPMTSSNHTAPSTPANWIQRLQGQVSFIRDRVQRLDRDGDPQDNAVLSQSYLQRLSEAVRVAVSNLTTCARLLF